MDASDSHSGDCEDVESFASSLLQLSLRLNSYSSHLVEDVHPQTRSQACHLEYVAFFMSVGILAIMTLFVGLGWCARMGPQKMLTGEADLAGVEHPTKPAVHLGAINGLRTIFTVWIVVYHQVKPLLPVILDGRAAMQFFFVVSGFVNVTAIETNVIAFSLKSGSLFIQKRIARLFPLLWFSMLLWAIVLKLTRHEERLCTQPWRWLVEATAMREVLPGTGFGVDYGVEQYTWFVSNLFVLNLCFPMLYNMSPSRPAAIACLIIMLIVVRSFLLIFPVPGAIPFLHYDNVAPRLSEFFVGMLSAAWCRQMQSHGSWSGWGCVFDASIMLAFLVIPIDHHTTSGDFGLTGVWCMTCISASFAAEAPSHVSPNPGVWPRLGLFGIILNCGPMQLLARYTYSIYVMQAPVNYALLFWWPGLLLDRFMTVLITILIGILAEVAIDQPVQRVFGRFIRDGFSE